MEFEITQNLIIDEMEIAEQRMKGYLQQLETVDFDEIKSFVCSNEGTVSYLDENLKISSADSKNVKYAWVDCGYGSEEKPVFFSLVKYDAIFSGHYVGTADFLAGAISENFGKDKYAMKKNVGRFQKKYIDKSKKYNRNRIGSEENLLKNRNGVFDVEILNEQNTKEGLSAANQPVIKESSEDAPQNLTSVTQKIYDNLLVSNWQSIGGLDRYIKIIGMRIGQLVEKDKQDFFVKNKIRSVIVNSGLMDSYGNDYLLLYKYHVKEKGYVVDDIIFSKQDYIDQGFSKMDIKKKIKPISFREDDETSFEAESLEEFDFTPRTLEHIIETNRDRFPESIQKESPDQLFSYLKRGLERGLELQRRDSSFVKASYSAKEKKNSWFMPLYINNKINQKPEMVLVIRKVREFYEIKTVLTYDDSETKDKITAMYLYRNVW